MKSKIILSILLISLFLVGCESGDKKTSVAGAFQGGTQGIIAEFEIFGVEEEGMYTIFDTEDFPIELTLRNKGEHELQTGDVTIKLMGPSPDEFSGIANWELQNTGTIGDVTENGEETITFASEASFNGEVTGLLDRNWFANIDYNYKTRLIIPEVCLKGDITDKSVCEIKEAKTFFVSGAPITVKSVEEDSAGKGIVMLKIIVSNVAGGKVTKLGEEFKATRDTLSFSIDDSAWECKSSGKINEARLIDGNAEIRCKLKEALNKDTVSTKKVELEFDYIYRDTIQESLRIKESAN